MRVSEAVWLRSVLNGFSVNELSPLIEVGASTREFRIAHQPHLDREIHAPLRARGVQLVAMDLKSGDGIDISGDLMDPDVGAKAKAVNANCVLCCNVFEHVTDRGLFAVALDAILNPGGLMVVTVPRSYPYHLDPIDTMFRPTPKQVQALFPSYELLQSEIVADTTFGQSMVARHKWAGVPRFLVSSLIQFLWIGRSFDHWKMRNHRFLWLLRRFKQTCVVLRKPASPHPPK